MINCWIIIIIEMPMSSQMKGSTTCLRVSPLLGSVTALRVAAPPVSMSPGSKVNVVLVVDEVARLAVHAGSAVAVVVEVSIVTNLVAYPHGARCIAPSLREVMEVVSWSCVGTKK